MSDADENEPTVPPPPPAVLVNRGGSPVTLVGVLNAVAVLVAIGWVWTLVRTQQQVENFSFDFDGASRGPRLVDRIDAGFQSTFLLAYAALTAGVAQIVGFLARRTTNP